MRKAEKITTEVLLTTMFEYGFDKIDPILFTFTMGEIIWKDVKEHGYDRLFDFSFDEPLSNKFKFHVAKINGVYKLKEEQEEMERWYKYHSNRLLFDYLDSVDFKKIIKKKMDALNIEVGDILKHPLFSEKEVSIFISDDKRLEKDMEARLEKQRREQEEIEKMATSTDYIEWLIEFTKKNNGGFYIDNWDYNKEKISPEDKEAVDKIPLFFDLVSEYVDHRPCNGGYFCKIKYNDEALHIGVMEGQGSGDHFVNAVSKTDGMGNPKFGYDVGCTDYKVVMEKYKKYHGIDKPKEYKKD